MVHRQGDDAVSFLHSDEADEYADLATPSMLGTIPVLTYLLAATYPLATSALDLEQTGIEVAQPLLDNAIVGLADVLGCLVARQGIDGSIAAATPTVTVVTAARGGAWRTTVLDGPDVDGLGPAVRAESRVMLDITAGRADVVGVWRRREIALDDVTGLLALAPVVEQVPGIPGRTALLTAVRAVTVLGGVLRLLPGMRGRD
jgi:hypothetical protein